MSQQNSQTPRDFLRALEYKFKVKITFDLACTTEDAVTGPYTLQVPVTGYYFDLGFDALKEDWSRIPVPVLGTGEEAVGFLNNPWKQTYKFASKCNSHSKGTMKETLIPVINAPGINQVIHEYEPGIRIFSLWPAGVGTNWFRQYVHGQADVYFLSPRLVYNDPRTGKPFVQVYPKKHPKAGLPKERMNKETGQVEHIPQTGLNDAILCDWAGSGETFCWNWQETLDELSRA